MLASPKGRAMTPTQIAEEIVPKPARWIRANVPPACRVPAKTRPPLFWEHLVRAWWETGAVAAGVLT